MMNRTFTIIREEFRRFEAPDWVVWFTVKLIPILPSFTAEMLVTVAAEINCTNYHVMWVPEIGDRKFAALHRHIHLITLCAFLLQR